MPYSGYSIKPMHLRVTELNTNTPTFPPEYQEFTDVFSGEKANMLAPHHPYNLQITTEGDMKPLLQSHLFLITTRTDGAS